MHFKILMAAIMLFAIASCSRHSEHAEEGHGHEEPKIQYTVYTDEFELFAEADAFVAGDSANILSHFSHLPEMKAVEEGKITLILNAGGSESRQTLDKPTRKGIYSFDLKPGKAGKGSLKFEITNSKGVFYLIVPEITVYPTEEQADEAASKLGISRTNTSVFTKEQSWKIDFETDYPQTGDFGQVIKTIAQVNPSQGNESVIVARTSGVVSLLSDDLLEGRAVSQGEKLFTVSGSGMIDNASVKYAEAESNYIKAKADYERAAELAKDRIVSVKELAVYKNVYDNAKKVFDNLGKSISPNGQTITSPISGFVRQLYVKNGSFVEAGQPVLTVSQNKTLVLRAEVPLKYSSLLNSITSANIRAVNGNTYTLEQLNGKILSVGKAAGEGNYLVPVSIRIDNTADFIPGSFLEIYLKTKSVNQAVNVPNTALLEEQGNYFVWVQVTPELFEKREVTVGTTDGQNTEILSGISGTDRIITRGAIMVKLAQSTGTLDAHSGHVH